MPSPSCNAVPFTTIGRTTSKACTTHAATTPSATDSCSPATIVNLLFYVALAFAIVYSIGNILLIAITAGIAAVRIISQYFVFGFAAKKLNEKQVIPGLILYDLLFALLNPLYFIDAQIRHDRFL